MAANGNGQGNHGETGTQRFARQLAAAREALGLTQGEFAAAIGVSLPSVASWETGRRKPARHRVIAAADALRRTTPELNAWLRLLEMEPVPEGRLRPLLDRRLPLAVLQDECDSYPWPCMAMNEDFEAIAWNAASNDISELDMGRDLAEPGARHLLRMALSDHYAEKLVNWQDVISIMIGMYKNAGANFMSPDSLTPYQQKLMQDIFQHPKFFELVALWEQTPPHREGTRSSFRAEWRTSTGEELLFDCELTAWSQFDGVAAFDWHPANAATWRWLESRAAKRPEAPPAPPLALSSAGELLRFARERHGLTRAQLAERVQQAGGRVSASLLEAVETGARGLSRRTALAVGRALDLDTGNLNAMLDAAGHDPVASDQSAYMLGHDFEASRRFSEMHGERLHWSLAAIQQEIDGDAWPILIVDGRCEVVASNRMCGRVLGLDVSTRRPGAERNLMTIVTEPWFIEGVEAWEAVVARILPGNLGIYDGPPEAEPVTKEQEYFEGVSRHILNRERTAGRSGGVLSRLRDAWLAAPDRRQTARVTFEFRWQLQAKLRFNAVITPWNGMVDPYWSIELHPADAETSEFLERVQV